ncbi:MAG: DUF5685 family protein [Clostridiales bacterium]|nr:DUF5685 family protein [Clostridiales bacterium]
MYGYIVCNKAQLTEEEAKRYEKVYCGLCRNLKKRFGQMERLSLTYDLTFLILFLSSLYEPEEKEEDFRCGIHPLQKRMGVENRFTEYASDMTILLTYYKCQDDWEDDHNHVMRWYGNHLGKLFWEISEKYPRQSRAVKESIAELSEIEKACAANPDRAVNASGKMLADIFVYDTDFWSKSLWSFGFELGRFIYLMDASMDYPKDIKANHYNPLIRMNRKPEEMEPILKMTMGKAMEIFEKLPLVQDVNLLRNILYGGVWQKYYGKWRGKEKTDG